MRRVFVTGIGCVTPIGNDRNTVWQNLVQGKSGIARLKTIPLDDLPINIGGEIKDLDFNVASINDKVNARKMDRATIFAVVSSGEAIKDAKLDPKTQGNRVGVVLGSGLSGLVTLQEQTENLLSKGPRGVSPFTIPVLMPNAAAANVSLAYDIIGPAYCVSSACSSSGHALIDAFEMIRRGTVDVMVTGGTEAPLTRLAISAFANMKAMTKKYNDEPTKGSRPFDRDRDGFVMSEGATAIILESEESMKSRGTQPYAEMVGYGMTMDSFHLVQPDPSARGAIDAMQLALKQANWDPAKVAGDLYVNAHGTSTKYNDLMETVAMKKIFGDAAKKLRISSTKSITGHMIGAAAATETLACVLGLHHGVLPPTINYENADPECDLDYIPNESRQAKCRYALNNTFGFGGHNVCLAFEAP